MSRLRTRLNKHDLKLLCLLFALLGGDLAFVVQIGLVAHKHDYHVVAALAADVVDPLGGVHEGGAIGDVVNDDGDARVPDVGGDQGAETFLSSSIPKL